MMKLIRILKGHVQSVIERRQEDWVYDRRDICNKCPHKKGVIRKWCGVCLCTIKVKTKFEDEECPLLKWKKQ